MQGGSRNATPRGSSVGEREWMPLGFLHRSAAAAVGGHLEILQWAKENGRPWNAEACSKQLDMDTSNSCSGPERKDVLGTKKRAGMQLEMGTSKSCRGRAKMDALGTRKRAGMPLQMGTLKFCSRRGTMDALGMRKRAQRQLNMDTSNSYNRLFVVLGEDTDRRDLWGFYVCMLWVGAHVIGMAGPWPVVHGLSVVLGTWVTLQCLHQRRLRQCPQRANVVLAPAHKHRPCPWDEETCWMAAGNGHLDVLQWARENRCPWDVNTCSMAASQGTS